MMKLLDRWACDLSRYWQMIFNLAKNDFRTRFVGSYFGLLWSLIQPVATILVFWFVFQIGFRQQPLKDGTPFVLWLAVGLAPWFFFCDAWTSASNAIIEYSYLVKKVLFRIEFLPIVKVLSAFFMHLAFVLVLVALELVYGRFAGWHLIQLFYYEFCIMALALALSLFTASVMPFFRDLGQIMGIGLNFGLWLTPIVWPVNMVPEAYRWIFKLNPVNYVVDGYRDAFLGGAWIWQHGPTTVGFWVVTALLGLLGYFTYRRLRPHFADVL